MYANEFEMLLVKDIPTVLLLDLKLSKVSGLEVLKEIPLNKMILNLQLYKMGCLNYD